MAIDEKRLAEIREEFDRAQRRGGQLVGAVRDLFAMLDATRDQAEKAEQSLSFSREWYAVRWERLRDLLRGTTHERHACAIMANGTPLRNDDGSFSTEPPTYAQLLNMKEWRAEAAEKRAEDAERKLAALREAVIGEVDDMSEHVADGDCAGPTGTGRRGACPTCRTAERLRAAIAAVSPPPHAHPRDEPAVLAHEARGAVSDEEREAQGGPRGDDVG